jgi:folate-binding protein YgfZ
MDIILPNRGVLAISGEDRIAFLQGLVTNDVTEVSENKAIYACLLSAQGRFLHDFMIVSEGERLLLDCEADRIDDLMKRLKMFRLRSRVEIADVTQGRTVRVSSTPVAKAYADPRDAGLGYRRFEDANTAVDGSFAEYDRLRISLGIPDGSRDMAPGEALPLENNIDVLNGIAWEKGCYVGQELTARIKYKAQARRRLVPVRLEGPSVEAGTLFYDGEREIGEMRSSCGDMGLALMRVDARVEEFTSGETRVKLLQN